MNGTDLLERRAERGAVRGAANVWADAQPVARSNREQHQSSAMLFRLALGAWVVALSAVALTQMNDDSLADTASEVEPLPAIDAKTEAILPDPVFVDGMQLQNVFEPWDEAFRGDDALFDDVFDGGPADRSFLNTQEAAGSSIIFAEKDDPFMGPIVGINTFDGGGFRPWSANTGSALLEDFTSYLESVDGQWTMSPESGLVEVARIDDDPERSLLNGWQFDYADGSDRIGIQAETNMTDEGLDEWTWIARLMRAGQTGPTVTRIDVLGEQGVLLDHQANSGNNDVIWAKDGFVYRMTVSRIEGDTDRSQPASTEVDRLTLGARSEWVDAVIRASRPSPGETITALLSMLAFAALVIAGIYFAFRRSFLAAGICAATAVIAFAVFSPGVLSVLVLLGALGLAWWSHNVHRRSRIL